MFLVLRNRRDHDHTHHSLLSPVPIQSIPNTGLPWATCWALTLARVWMGLSPEFSARAIGMVSMASAKALIAYCSMVDIWCMWKERRYTLLMHTPKLRSKPLAEKLCKAEACVRQHNTSPNNARQCNTPYGITSRSNKGWSFHLMHTTPL